MKINDSILTPQGPARLITMPVGKQSQTAVVLYPDGRGVEVDLSECRVAVSKMETATERTAEEITAVRAGE